jgi:hypothetical protein
MIDMDWAERSACPRFEGCDATSNLSSAPLLLISVQSSLAKQPRQMLRGAHRKRGRIAPAPDLVALLRSLHARTWTVGDFHPAVLQFANTVRRRHAVVGFTKALAGDRATRDTVASEIRRNRRSAAFR